MNANISNTYSLLDIGLGNMNKSEHMIVMAYKRKKKSVKYKGYSFPFSHDEGTFFFPTLFILKLHFDSLHDLSNVSKLLLKS